MFVKTYIYYVQKDKIQEFLDIQKRAGEIYGQYISSQTTYLQSKEDKTKWMEITTYRSEEEYNKSIRSINEDPEIQQLFHSFEALLVEGKGISEENFTDVLAHRRLV
ncbi:hypothetical protein [Oceanobacillus kapialis]|uniref:ABM domain-containing protein n=2 Tax=Bacillati TaxID=1783272 RepID=A0ABW5Q255_9BACI